MGGEPMVYDWEIVQKIKEAREQGIFDFSYLDEKGERVEVHFEDCSKYPTTDTDYF